eukprot:31272-Pelagococcus_subviridis.AAC.9
MNALNAPSHCAPTAPSTTLWSHDSVALIRSASSYPLPSAFFTTSFLAAPTARIAACGGFTIAANCLIPNIPRFEIVKVPPIMSAGESFPSFAFPASALTSDEIPERPSPHAFRTMGTIRPASVCTATLMSAFLYTRILSPIHDAFTSGTCLRADAAAFTTKSFTEIFPFSFPALSFARAETIWSMRTSTLR